MSNRVDELVERLHQSGQIDQLAVALQQFDPRQLDDEERESWYHLWGIAAFQQGDRPAALERFTEGLTACPESGRIRFSLGQEFEHIGNDARMIELFNGCRFPDVPAQYAMMQAQYAYLWDRIEQAVEYVLPIVDAYYELRIADDTFLYMRDLPFFGVTWAYLGAFYELMGDLDRLVQFTEESSQRLSDYDFDDHFQFIESVRSRDFSPVLAALHESIADGRRQGHPVGHHAIKAAVIELQIGNSSSSAADPLAAVELEAHDFPWLEDIRLLAQCRQAHESGDIQRERRLQDAFLQNQPLLFEPEHAFNFRLLDYQETLKKRYRRSKQASDTH